VGGFVQRVVDRLFAASLWLYPASFRRRYGEEMRAVFRARLRDAEQAPLRDSAAMLIDAFGAAGRAQGDAFGHRGAARVAAMLALLLFALLCATQRMQLAVVLLDGREASMAWWKERPVRTYAAFERKERRRAAELLANGSPDDRWVAGLVLSQPSWLEPVEHVHSEELLNLVARASTSAEPMHLHHALSICLRVPGCDWRASVAQLQRRDADNAAAWLLIAATSRATDPAAAERALRRAAGAREFRSVGAEATAHWLEWSATRPFEASWWQAESPAPALALHYWFVTDALPAYRDACSLPPSQGCLDVADRWHATADSLRLRLQLTDILHRARFGVPVRERNPAAAILARWKQRLTEPFSQGAPIDPRALAQRLRTAGEPAAIAEFAN
jgi:hypothetical protein